ncbi:MAG: glycoside hydrolase family 127 protein [Candidatus Aminicenantes bacterium]|nr:glycoside hydrolase family 127 protein [Candidatus Aminicenantes bacterium]
MTSLNRREFLTHMTAGAVALAAPGLPAKASAGVAADLSAPVPSGLSEPKFRPLPLGSIRALGWLERQLRIQADGLSGHLDEFWPDVQRSKWFGGEAEGWERAPYWMDGFIPLAWSLDDPGLKAKASRHIEEIVAGQRADGWFAPYPEDAAVKKYDLWAILLANKMLAQYHDATGDDKVLRAVERSLRAMAAGLDRTPLYDWGRYRWFEGLVPIFHVYERTGEKWLLDLGRKLRAQGFDYEAFYRGEDVTVPTPRRGLWKWAKHVVNTGMAPKASALSWRLGPDQGDPAFPARMIALLDRYHGQVTGMFTGDECLAGKNPLQGTELCAVVEFMYSLEVLLSVLGDPAFGDRLEQVAFNALPAAFTPDMWAHQYDQQVNQIQATINPDHLWTTNGPESNIFGLEPNFGCCTANMHQGWPKFAAHLWMRTPDEGLAAVAYAPSRARFLSRGVPVTAELRTDYPFRETLTVSVTAERPAKFPLLLRVPAWAQAPTLRVAGGAATPLRPGTFHRLDREWAGTVEIELRFPMRAATTIRYNESVAVERGPLVYALKLGEERTRVNADKPQRELPHGDFEVRPTTPWNYGLVVDDKDAAVGLTFEEKPVGERPFSPQGAGMSARVKGRRLKSWRLDHGWAAEYPPGIHESAEPLEELELLPYGCTNIRLTEFPRLKK